MWLFTRYGFYSTACAERQDGGIDSQTLMVRARDKGHLLALRKRFHSLAETEVVTLAHRDYRYRIMVSKDAWAGVVAELAQEQEWSNFKNEAKEFQGSGGSDYVRALHRVWRVMYDLQGKGST